MNTDPNMPGPTAQATRRWIPIVFFALTLLGGQMLVDDYGVSWDEFPQRIHGLVAFDYINGLLGHPFGEEKRAPFELSTYAYRYHGLLFTTVCVFLENIWGVEDPRDIYLLRHRCTALLSWVASVFFYLLLASRFGDWRPALLGGVFLVASPRLFADSFYNPKDAVFMSFYIISGYTLVQFLRRPTALRSVAHALACSLALSSRIAGLFLPSLTLAAIAVRIVYRRPSDVSRSGIARATAIYLLATLAFTYAFWPALWADPVGGIREVARQASGFKWNLDVLFAGKFFAANELPWTYLPVWISLTTPPLYLVLMLMGAGVIVWRVVTAIRRKGSFPGEDAILFLLGAGPLLGAIVGADIHYDGWRHLYFVYPFLLAVAVVGLMAFLGEPPTRCRRRLAVAGIVVIVSLLRTAAFMVSSHPQQQVFFNVLAGHRAHLRYDADYWGVSYRQALEELLRRDARPLIKVTAANFPLVANVEMLRKEDRARVQLLTRREGAEYYLTNFRGARELADLAGKRPPFDREVFVLSTRRTAIVGVYKFADPPAAE